MTSRVQRTVPRRHSRTRRGAARLAAITAAALAASVLACSSFSGDTPAPVEDAGPVVVDDAGVSEAAPPLDAEVDVLVPDVLVPGDGGVPKLLVFVTSGGFSDVRTPAGADTKCTLEAAGRLSGKFVAWYSGLGKSAIDRLVTPGGVAVDGPWYRPDGSRVVSSRLALGKAATTPLEHPISQTLTGTPMSGGVWTGTLANGTPGSTCPVASGGMPTKGIASAVDAGWTDSDVFGASCTDSLALYCFQVE